MRRELALKNYHIAALNERFIRIEERIQTLGSQMADLRAPTLEMSDAEPGSRRMPGDVDPQVIVPQIPLHTLDAASENWSKTLDEWHQRLDGRFDQLDELHSRVRARRNLGEQASQPAPGYDAGEARGQGREGPAT